MADDYITLAELTESLSLGSETFADADIERAITAASREVDRRCNRRFWQQNGTRYYTATDPARLWIDDLIGLDTLEVDTGGAGSFTEWEQDTDFLLAPLNASIDQEPWTCVVGKNGQYLPLYDAAVRVSGTFGWLAVPEVVKEATSILAARFMKRVREAPFGVAGFGIDGGAIRVSNSDPDVDALLAGLVRTNFG